MQQLRPAGWGLSCTPSTMSFGLLRLLENAKWSQAARQGMSKHAPTSVTVDLLPHPAQASRIAPQQVTMAHPAVAGGRGALQKKGSDLSILQKMAGRSIWLRAALCCAWGKGVLHRRKDQDPWTSSKWQAVTGDAWHDSYNHNCCNYTKHLLPLCAFIRAPRGTTLPSKE